MPELPDLQVFAKNLNQRIAGKTIKAVRPIKGKLNVSKAELKKALEGQVLEEIFREGKELHFRFGNGHVLGVHLMLNGKLFLYSSRHEQKWPMLELDFSDDTGLVLTDFQTMATVTLDPGPSEAPDAVSEEADAAYLKKRFGRSRSAVKKLLLDQHIIRGIGNAYADEILWRARISPFSVAQKVPAEQVDLLVEMIRKVLKEAEQKILSAHPDIINGEYREFLEIHNSKKTHSPSGALIRHAMLNSRKTYYTDEQELFA